ncbi:hypothetical protein ACLKA6_012793 [Drosophila palustris]
MVKSQVTNEKVFKPFVKYFEKQWIMKEGPENITVFKRTTRTTGSLEAQNGVLGKRLMKHGNFFKFVSYLLTYEYTKSREFDLLIKSGGATAPSKKRVYKQRADKIADASEELEKGKITAAIFLNRMSYPGTKICQGLEDFTCVDDDQPGNCELSDDDDADDTQRANSQRLSFSSLDHKVASRSPLNHALALATQLTTACALHLGAFALSQRGEEALCSAVLCNRSLTHACLRWRPLLLNSNLKPNRWLKRYDDLT